MVEVVVAALATRLATDGLPLLPRISTPQVVKFSMIGVGLEVSQLYIVGFTARELTDNKIPSRL
jgi:phage tail sheath gpL-like